MPKKKKTTLTDRSPQQDVRLQAILDTAVDGIIIIDEAGRIESFNTAAGTIFGYRESEVRGKNVAMLMPEPHRSKHTDYIRRYLQTGQARIIGIGREVTGLRADGTLFPMDLAVSEVVMEHGRKFTGIIRDISERKRLEQAIVDASEMERKQIGQDLHDTVSQHLAGLTMIAGVLKKKIQQAGHDAAPMAEDAAHLFDLANTALKQVKNISHGLYPVELERNGLGTALQQFTSQQDDLFGIDCQYSGPTRLPPLDRSAAVHLYRIVQEAVSNAIKHAEPSQIWVSLECTGNTISVRVRDDGKGLPNKHGTNSGLGLAIMKYRANMLGTELELSSTPDKGTVVRCTLPLE